MVANRSAARGARQDQVFRAIADRTRRDILGLLRNGQQSVGEIAAHFRMTRPGVSKHIGVLRSAGLVLTREEGTVRRCRLNAKPLRDVDDWLQSYSIFWSDTLQGLKSYIEDQR
jgi:DNA-binding transcriptional ArsR family regulator